jgi:hypothetical protein
MTFPMLADFALRLACGLALLLLLTPWRLVPPAFFRTHCLVTLGLLVLAGLDAWRLGVRGPALVLLAAGAVLAYVAAVAWGLGLPRVGVPLTALIVAACAGDLAVVSRSAEPLLWALNTAGRLASSFLMGATLTAMLLGHHYLTAPAMSIEPLKRFVRGMAWGLGARAVLAGVGLGVWVLWTTASATPTVSPLFLAVRWGMGVFGPAVAAVLTWKTVQIRSTQSATGILYIALALVLFGELTAMVLSREAGVIL